MSSNGKILSFFGARCCLAIVLICFPFTGASGQSHLHTTVTLSAKTTISQALEEIETQVDFKLTYSSTIIREEAVILKDTTGFLISILDLMFPEQSVQYIVKGNKLLLVPSNKNPEKYFQIYGYIRDETTGEAIPYTNCYLQGTTTGTSSNEAGYFNFTTPLDTCTLVVSHIGYQTKKVFLSLTEGKGDPLFIDLMPVILDGLTISYKEDPPHLQTLTGKTNISSERMAQIPAMLGTTDIMRAITFLPGITNGREGTTQIFVRGGGQDQNLILVDEAPVYTSSHMGGFVSIFNNEAIKDVDIYKGGFPARYGGRLSSVLDINMKEGDYKKLGGKIYAGITSAGGLIEGPIGKDKNSFLLSARTALTGLAMLPLYSDVSYNFYDINGKFNHRIKDTGKIFLSFYLNGDRASATDEFRDRSYVNNTKLNLNNRSLTLGYNTKLSPKLFVENYLIHSSYSRYVNEETISSKDLGRESNISTGFSVQDNIWKTRFGLTTNRHKIKFGADAHWKEFIPTQFISVQGNDLVPLDTIRNITEVQQAIEISPYVEDELRITKGLNINLGLRFPFYLTKTAKYNFLEPRASLRWLMTESFSLKAGYARMYQFTHALINNFNSMEHEIWLSAHENLPPQSTDIISLGVFTQWKKKLDIGLEGYYKKMASLIEYKPSVEEMYQTDQFENFLEKGGTGEAYGMELFAQGPLGPGFASLSYTLSWNFRQFENINFGRPYPFLFDRRHVLDITAQYPLNEKWGLSTAWTFNSGRATNLPVAYIKTNEYYLGYYAFEGKNQQNLPPYHRLDISAKRESKTKKRGRYQYISFNLYNAYLRKNPVMVYFMPQDEKAHKVTSFFVVPSVSYGLTF